MEESSQINKNPTNIILILFRYRIIILVSILISIFISLIYGFTAPIKYSSNVTVIQNEKISSSAMPSFSNALGGLAGIPGLGVGADDSKLNIALARMDSRVFSNELFRNYELYPYLFPDLWNKETNDWISAAPSNEDVFKEVKKIFSVSSNKLTGITSVTVIHPDPNFTAFLANKIIEKINFDMRQEEIRDSQRSIDYLKEELKSTNLVNIESVFYSLIEQETQKGMLANVDKDFMFKVIDPAVVPDSRYSPRRSRILLIGTSLGFLTGIFLALLFNFYQEERKTLELNKQS